MRNATIIGLDQWQQGHIAPLLDNLAALAEAGRPGMIVGQVFDGHMVCGVLTHDESLAMQQIMGTPQGQLRVSAHGPPVAPNHARC